MALNMRMRAWLRSASEDALLLMGQEVSALAEQIAECRRRVVETEANLGSKVAQAQTERDELRQRLTSLAEEQARRDHERTEQLEALQRGADEMEASSDEIRIKIAGLVEQWRWESEDLRKAFAALAQQARKPG